MHIYAASNLLSCSCSFLKNLVPSFNECADKMIKKLMLFADGKTSVKISEEFTLFTLNVISKVKSQLCMIYVCMLDIISASYLQVAFGSDFSDPEWKDVYKLKHSKGEQGLFYLVSHALRGAQMSLAFPLFKVSEFACSYLSMNMDNSDNSM